MMRHRRKQRPTSTPLAGQAPLECVVELCELSAENGSKVYRAADALSGSLYAVRSRVNAIFPGTYA